MPFNFASQLMKILVIGGSRGIGLALAKHYLEQGHTVGVCSRHKDALSDDCFATFPRLVWVSADVADREALRKAIHDFAEGQLDLLIVSAGFYASAEALRPVPELGLQIMATNVTGIINAFDAASEIMRPQQKGQLVAIASIAGLLRDYPTMSLYSLSKKAAGAVVRGYRKALAPWGIQVNLIMPGYVDTARLRELDQDKAGQRAFLCSETEAVHHIVQAMTENKPEYAFPWQWVSLIRMFNCLPNFLRRFRKK